MFAHQESSDKWRKIKTFHVQALRRSVWILLNLHTVAHVSGRTWQKPAIRLLDNWTNFRYYTLNDPKLLVASRAARYSWGWECSHFLQRDICSLYVGGEEGPIWWNLHPACIWHVAVWLAGMWWCVCWTDWTSIMLQPASHAAPRSALCVSCASCLLL